MSDAASADTLAAQAHCVSEAVAEAFHNAKDLPQEVQRVAQRDIAGAGFEPATFGL